MAIKYLASKRITGTNAERPTFTPQGWKEVDRDTLTSTSNSLQVASLPNKRYFMVLGHIINNNTSEEIVSHIRLNNRSTSGDYSDRGETNNVDTGATSSNRFIQTHKDKYVDSRFFVGHIANYSDKDKLGIFRTNENVSAGTEGNAINCVGKGYSATFGTNISSIDVIDDESGVFAEDSELVVLEFDPDDTHTTGQFWELLDTANGSGDSFDTGAFTAKKYLWVQVWWKATGGDVNNQLRVGSGGTVDDTAVYGNNTQQNGAGWSDDSGQTYIHCNSGTTNSGETGFANFFIVNKSGKEKLMIGDEVQQIDDASHTDTTPNRRQVVAKWKTTSGQINCVGLNNNAGSGDYTATSYIKVWGHD